MANYFKPSMRGQIELRNSPEVQRALLSEANSVANAAESYTSGLAYRTDVQAGKTRAHAMVKTANPKSYYVQMKHKNLSSALG